ncbi:MAG TPA: transposase [Casimicrobiaceae bacterium]|nr:transposase [Casimicrobiaceae bacterium]
MGARATARTLKAIHAREDRRSAQDKIGAVIAKLKAMRLPKAAESVEATARGTLTYLLFPSNHRRQIKTNNPLQRIVREIRRRTRVVGVFPDGCSALMSAAARLRHIASTKWAGYRQPKCERLLTSPCCNRISHGWVDDPVPASSTFG